jgi:hypothetical protein
VRIGRGSALACEHAFVTAQGSPYARFRRALDRGNILEARLSAGELKHVALSEALELVILGAQKEPDRHPRMALRWTARFATEVGGVSPEEAQAVLSLLLLLSSPRRVDALRALAALVADQRRLPSVVDRLGAIADSERQANA